MTQILQIVKKNTELSLSLYQLNNIYKKLRLKTVISETTDVHDYVIEKGGYSVYCDVKIDGTIHRQAVATFNQKEPENLARYGDFVSIDPTFTPMISNWSIIPITIVNKERRIEIGGFHICIK